MPELRSGTSVTPTLRLLRPLGQGGMGRVWVAEHLTLETSVVVKFMAKEIADTADGAARFAREASVSAAVKSPHVVQVFDHGVTPDGDAYIVMELLEGRDLAAHLAAHGPMAPADVAALVAQVAKALGKAHQVGVVHRDIKPDNIFLCEADGGELFVKLLDFGIAKREQRITDAATTTGAVVGTPYYMSPEQILGEKDIDARTDIWSLGVVAFEAMVGKRPFDGPTVGAVTLAIHTKTPCISALVPGAPAALDAWFAQACAREPKSRFQTARDASQALLQAVGKLPAGDHASLLRAPVASLADVGETVPSLASDHEAAPSDGRAATNLSSVFPAPRAASRARPTLVLAGIAAVLVVGVVFAMAERFRARPEPAPPVSAPQAAAEPRAISAPNIPMPPSATVVAPPPSAATVSDPVPSTSAPAARAPTLIVAPAAPTLIVAPAAPTLILAPAAPTLILAPAAPRVPSRPLVKPSQPARTRDDDDIK